MEVKLIHKTVYCLYKNGADLIKITATGGVMSMAKNGQNPQFTEEVMRAIVNTANDYGMHVAAHAAWHAICCSACIPGLACMLRCACCHA